MDESGQGLSPGTWYAWVPKPTSLPSFLTRSLSLGRSTTERRVSHLLRQSTKAIADARLVPTDGPLASGSWNASPHSYSLGPASLVACFGLFEVAGQLQRVAPNVHYDPARTAACVFSGHLSNLEELLERYGAGGGEEEGHHEGHHVPVGSDAGGRDPRQLATEVVLRMARRVEDPLVLLSELQGQYSFVLYDHDKRHLLAARDSSGSEPLFYELDDDGGASFTNNAALEVPADVGFVRWAELPPGYFISGRSPKLQQFALTPEQLSIREAYESMDDDLSPTFGSGEKASGLIPSLFHATVC